MNIFSISQAKPEFIYSLAALIVCVKARGFVPLLKNAVNVCLIKPTDSLTESEVCHHNLADCCSGAVLSDANKTVE